MSTTTAVVNGHRDGVREIFAQVTRYPLEVLDPDAGLEEDLGIDSVKLGEVFAVLREKYGLPEKLDLPREQLRTIGGITEALQAYLRGPAEVELKNAQTGEPVRVKLSRDRAGEAVRFLEDPGFELTAGQGAEVILVDVPLDFELTGIWARMRG